MDLKTIQDLDADDEALVKYKQTLLGKTDEVLGTYLMGGEARGGEGRGGEVR